MTIKTLIGIIIITAFTLVNCTQDTNVVKADTNNAIPTANDCIRVEIERIKKSKVRNPPSAVYQYTYKDKIVYFIPSYCCDVPSVLLNESCESICSPDGGFDGKGDGKCEDFFDARTNEILIWQDSRTN